MLAISTVTKKAYIALSYNGQESFAEIDADCRQSENILLEIDKMLEKNNITLREIENIAVVVGPGSFTGIRIGVALVKGLCAGDKSHKVTPISTLDLMAKINIEENKPTKDFICMLNALSGRYFICRYSKEGKKLSEEEMVTEESISKLKLPIVTLNEEFKDVPGVDISAKHILEEGLSLERAKKFVSADKLTPVYIRKAQAEENLDWKI